MIAFDLDGTIWNPEMYQLWGGGPPFSVVDNNTLVDRSGTRVQLCGISGNIFDDLKHNPIFSQTIVALVSCTDEPEWAEKCLQMFVSTPNKVPLVHCVHEHQIFKANKRSHFKNIHEKYKIEYSDMIFFDNERTNIDSVRMLGVHCIYCPEGVLEDVWQGALRSFNA